MHLRDKIVNPIQRMFRTSFFLFSGLVFISSVFQFIAIKNKSQDFLVSIAKEIARSADLDGDYLSLQKKFEQALSSIKYSGLISGNSIIYLNGRKAAEAGIKSNSLTSVNIGSEFTLPSGNLVRISIDLDLLQTLGKEFYFTTIVLLLLFGLYGLIIKALSKSIFKILSPLEDLVGTLEKAESIDQLTTFSNTTTSNIIEIDQIVERLKTFLVRLSEQEKQIKYLKQEEALGQLAQQVAHDIRSPLSALTIAVQGLATHTVEHKELIQNAVKRICEIADDLMQRAKPETNLKNSYSGEAPNTIAQTNLTLAFMPGIIESVINEKRLALSGKGNLEISAEYQSPLESFANVNPRELGRSISNLIDNSAEAIDHSKGLITVGCHPHQLGEEKYIEIFITDNGRGIPGKIVSKLGTRGFSYGKEGLDRKGSGLGLYHAKGTAELFGGYMEIQSEEKSGTTVSLFIPRAVRPSWLPASFNLSGRKYLVCLMDTVSQKSFKFEKMNLLQSLSIQVLFFSKSNEFESYFLSNLMEMKDSFYIIYNELSQDSRMGIELIESLGIEKSTILITDSCFDVNILSKAERLNLKIIPKTAANQSFLEIQSI